MAIICGRTWSILDHQFKSRYIPHEVAPPL
ncbi:unnamed protein product [Acanthoscelides obtectus]|uniref:Uncharacterized protein n=1 Tax=Acanthoscelides obtectus TaxID=200917 RepID=A0A9P0KFE3_ACAOB|nr:unnamed protein product [Acanthoscelides obtectus]CAK1647154.1 hypothetical protein AOBTE_LOCUS15078 [Acanthoscelides obtectus]